MQTVSPQLKQEAVDLLKKLITIPSFSREEDKTASAIADFFRDHGIPTQRQGNNVWAKNLHFKEGLPTILLNSHHDTVKPNPAYTRDPFAPTIENGKLYGLGSNDAGGPLVALIATFVHYYTQQLEYNLVFAASAEEEISGTGGIESVWPFLPRIDFAIVGEPTLTDIAVAEKGLMVLDCLRRKSRTCGARGRCECHL